jgi:hypothetical protein
MRVSRLRNLLNHHCIRLRAHSSRQTTSFTTFYRVITCCIKPASLKHQLSVVSERHRQPHLHISAYMHTASRPTTQQPDSSPYAHPSTLPESFSIHTYLHVSTPKIPTSFPLCRDPSTGEPLQAHGHPETQPALQEYKWRHPRPR